MLKIRTRFLGKRGYTKLKKLDHVLISNTGPRSLHGITAQISRDIWDNIIARYDAKVWGYGTGRLLSVLHQQRDGLVVTSPDTAVFEAYIGDADLMDRETKVITKGTGAEFAYWSLLEFGWGQEGGSSRTPNPYVLYYKERRGPPAWVEASATEYFGMLTPVMHPGREGIFVFLTKAGAMHAADVEIAPKYLERLRTIFERIGQS